jgi:biotin synthase
MDHQEIRDWLGESDPQRLEALWSCADQARRRHVGDAVHLRGLIKISNHCGRLCAYCGLRAPNHKVGRYRMTREEVVACVRQAQALGYGTVVLQAGEDAQLTQDWMTGLLRRIKTETALAVTLSLGERSVHDLAAWRAAGADRYLLRFETSNAALYERVHPARGDGGPDRLVLLSAMRQLGYEVGSGVMVGLPGQSYEDLANDLELFRDLDLDVVGVGPYLPHPDTPLGAKFFPQRTETGNATRYEPHLTSPASGDETSEQVPNSELMTYKVLALARLLCQRASIPSTTSLVTLNPETGRELGLMRGANVVMPNLTPPQYRRLYEIYPEDAYQYDDPDPWDAALRQHIVALGRTVGTGRGDAPRRPSQPADA